MRALAPYILYLHDLYCDICAAIYSLYINVIVGACKYWTARTCSRIIYASSGGIDLTIAVLAFYLVSNVRSVARLYLWLSRFGHIDDIILVFIKDDYLCIADIDLVGARERNTGTDITSVELDDMPAMTTQLRCAN